MHGHGEVSSDSVRLCARLHLPASSLGSVNRELGLLVPLARQGDVSESEVIRLERQRSELEGRYRNERNRFLRDAAAELEMGMHRLHQIFVDISSMVERQGGVVESVEAHVARSAACVESGAAALDDARALRAKRRRRTMVAVAIAAGVLAVVAMLVLAGFARG